MNQISIEAQAVRLYERWQLATRNRFPNRQNVEWNKLPTNTRRMWVAQAAQSTETGTN